MPPHRLAPVRQDSRPPEWPSAWGYRLRRSDRVRRRSDWCRSEGGIGVRVAVCIGVLGGTGVAVLVAAGGGVLVGVQAAL